MQIIKHGKLPQAHVICAVCGCEFIAEPEDIFCVGDRSLQVVPHLACRCPDCDHYIDWYLGEPNAEVISDAQD